MIESLLEGVGILWIIGQLWRNQKVLKRRLDYIEYYLFYKK